MEKPSDSLRRRGRLGAAAAALVSVVALLAGCASAPEVVLSGDATEVRRRIEAGEIDLGARLASGETWLHGAALGGHVDVARLFVERGADVNAQDDRRMTPLHHACHARATAMVEYLLAQGASPSLSVVAANGGTPLLMAVTPSKLTRPGVISLPTGAVIVTDHGGVAPAVPAIVELLLDAGADPDNPRSAAGNTALHLAAYHGDADVVKLLLKHGADPVLLNNSGATVLDMARAGGHEITVGPLLVRSTR